jgi:hypothetical protein
MQMQKYTSDPLIPKTPGMLTRRELRAFLNIGVNEVPKIIERFGLPLIEDHVPEHSVWNLILHLDPQDDGAADALRVPLRDINWLSQMTGKSVSNIRSKIKSKTFQYPSGVQLGVEGTDKSTPRLRRWPEAIILPLLSGCPSPNFDQIVSNDSSLEQPDCTAVESAKTESKNAGDNVFGEIASLSAQSSQQRSA